MPFTYTVLYVIPYIQARIANRHRLARAKTIRLFAHSVQGKKMEHDKTAQERLVIVTCRNREKLLGRTDRSESEVDCVITSNIRRRLTVAAPAASCERHHFAGRCRGKTEETVPTIGSKQKYWDQHSSYRSTTRPWIKSANRYTFYRSTHTKYSLHSGVIQRSQQVFCVVVYLSVYTVF